MSSDVQTTPARGIFRDSTRYAVMAVSIVCLTAVLSNSLALNFTVICMNDGTANSTSLYTEDEKGWLFSAVAVGTLIGTLPITTLMSRYGMRIVFTAVCAISAVSTLLTPLAVSIGFIWVFIMRMLQGMAVVMSFPALGTITAHWSTLKGSGVFIALLSIHLQLGPIFTMPLSGAFCVSELGWPAIYYLQGGISVFASALFYVFYRDSPRIHTSVSGKELSKIELGKSISAHREPTPYRAILTNWPVWGVWVSSVGGNLGFLIFMQYGPIYLNKVLNYEIESTGFATAIPFVASCLVKFVAGPFSDRATCISEKTRMIIFAIISQGCMALCFVALSFIPIEMSFLAWLAYTSAITFSGLNCVGVVKCAQMVARQHVGFVMSIHSLISSTIVLLLPVFVRLVAPDNEAGEWAILFWIIAAVIFITNVFFLFVADASPAEWTKSSPRVDQRSRIHPLDAEDLDDPKVHIVS